MPDFYVKPFANSDRFDVKSPMDQVEASDPKAFPGASKLHDPWGWYPFLYLNPAQLLLGGLGDFSFSSQGVPNLNFNIPSIEIYPGGGGFSGGGGGGAGDGGLTPEEQGCTPAVLAGSAGEGSQVEICRELLDPCDFINLMNATAASELGDWDTLSDKDNNRLTGGGEEPFAGALNMDAGTCPSSDTFFRFTSMFRIIEIPAGIFCSTLSTCISFSYGATFQRCLNRLESDGSVTELCATLCSCGNSGHGNLPAGGADFSSLYKAFANCLKFVNSCSEPIVEAESGCPNCDITTDALGDLDTTF